MTSPQVLLASCADLPSSDGDESGLVAALEALGLRAAWAPWDDAETDFAAADLVVLRATWDYPHRREEFLKWCESVPRLANPAHVARWNTDKAYLLDLAEQGVAVIPTQIVGPSDRPEWPEGEFVVKPAVGAGSRGASRFRPAEHGAAAEHLSALRAEGTRAVVQPYQPAVDREGETALVFFNGVYSHAFGKAPMLPDEDAAAPDPSGLFAGEKLRPSRPAEDLRRAGEDALDAACRVLGLGRAELLYARVDLVRDAGGAPLLLELEVTEPALGFAQTDAAAALERFASAVRAGLAGRIWPHAPRALRFQ
ncbi:ATP-grasp domain-containing protein [Bounagaea algeriensis]